MFETNKSLQKILKLSLDKKYLWCREYNYNLFDYFCNYYAYKGRSWNTFTNRYGIQANLTTLLKEYNISYQAYPKYEEEYVFLLDIQPSWVDCFDDSIFRQIMDEIPQELYKTKRIALGKEKIKALFKYDKTYPRWVQGRSGQ